MAEPGAAPRDPRPLDRDLGPCRVRPWRAADADALARHANDASVARWLRDRFPHPYTRADAEAFLARAAAPGGASSRWAIEVAGEAAGGIGLELRDDVERVSAEIGYWLGAPFRGRGAGTAAVAAVTRYAFAELGLARVYAVPFRGNAASMRVLEKAGYRLEGVLRRAAIKDGRVLDQLLYARTDLDAWAGEAAEVAPRDRCRAERINLADKLAAFTERWSPRIVAELNDHQVKLARLEGEFVWHRHEREDELFLVLGGRLRMRFRDRDVVLAPGELLVVPRGVEHCPVAEGGECQVLLVEPASTLNTGDVRDARTVERPGRI